MKFKRTDKFELTGSDKNSLTFSAVGHSQSIVVEKENSIYSIYYNLRRVAQLHSDNELLYVLSNYGLLEQLND